VVKAIREAGLPAPVREHPFHPVRRWRFDFAWPEQKLALEVDGTGRHNTVAGMANDNEKINEAQIMGWTVIRANAKNVAATGKPGKGARKLPYEPLVSVLARAWASRNT
jgi:very-short-patch-repair endonuclease